MTKLKFFLVVVPFPFLYFFLFFYKSYKCVRVETRELHYTTVILIVKCYLVLTIYVLTFWQECFDPIVATSGRDLIPVMVYG